MKERNQHSGSGSTPARSEHTTWRRAAPVDALRRLDTDEALLVHGNQPPTWLRLRPWWK